MICATDLEYNVNNCHHLQTMDIEYVPTEILNIICEYAPIKDLGCFFQTCSTIHNASEFMWWFLYKREYLNLGRNLEWCSLSEEKINIAESTKKLAKFTRDSHNSTQYISFLKNQFLIKKIETMDNEVQSILTRDQSLLRYNDVITKVDRLLLLAEDPWVIVGQYSKYVGNNFAILMVKDFCKRLEREISGDNNTQVALKNEPQTVDEIMQFNSTII
jgi:hypothetical protein